MYLVIQKRINKKFKKLRNNALMLTQHSLFLQHTFGKILIIQNDEALENKLATFDIEDDE